MEAQVKKVIQWFRNFLVKKLHYKNEDLPYYLTILIAVVLFVFALNAFVDLTQELARNALTTFDTKVTDYFVSHRNKALTSYLLFVTYLGARNGYLIIIVFLGLYFLLRHKSRKFILQILTVLVLATLSNIALKEVFNRARPTLEHMVQVYTLSYPSGHAMSAMAFYGFLIFLVIRYNLNPILKAFLVGILSVIILSIGISRIYLGVHFPSDVLAGFIAGLMWVTFCAIVFDVIDLLRKRKSRIAALKSSSIERNN